MTLTREQIEALLKLAEAATPGPWQQHLVDDTTVTSTTLDVCCTFPDGGRNDDVDFAAPVEQHEANAAYIAAANPAVLKALCTLALQAEAMQPRPIASVSVMQSTAGPDYYVQFDCGGRTTTPYKFKERYKAEYHVAHFNWIFHGWEEPQLMDYNPESWPGKSLTSPGAAQMSDELLKLRELAKVATPDLPEALRVPLHELQADTAYLLGRVHLDGTAAIPHVQNSILNRLSQIETACYHMNASLAEAAARISALEAEVERLREAHNG